MRIATLLQFFTPADLTTAEYIEKRGGRLLDKRKSESIGEISQDQASKGFTGLTESYTDERVPLLPIEEMTSLSDSRQIVFFAGVHGPSPSHRRCYWNIPRLAGLYDPDPFHVN
jgi:type IV secretion system protein VirD4